MTRDEASGGALPAKGATRQPRSRPSPHRGCRLKLEKLNFPSGIARDIQSALRYNYVTDVVTPDAHFQDGGEDHCLPATVATVKPEVPLEPTVIQTQLLEEVMVFPELCASPEDVVNPDTAAFGFPIQLGLPKQVKSSDSGYISHG